MIVCLEKWAHCLIIHPFLALLLSMLTRFCFPYYETLILGRFLWGTANGIAIVVQTVWVVESASTIQRGFVNSWQEVIATIGHSFHFNFLFKKIQNASNALECFKKAISNSFLLHLSFSSLSLFLNL